MQLTTTNGMEASQLNECMAVNPVPCQAPSGSLWTADSARISLRLVHPLGTGIQSSTMCMPPAGHVYQRFCSVTRARGLSFPWW